MIIEYHRPKSLEEALSLLAQSEPPAVPLGGGTAMHRLSGETAAVDLQALGLDGVAEHGAFFELGAALTLQGLLDACEGWIGSPLLPALEEVIRREATHNLRQAATLAGTLVAAGGRSPLAAAMLALDAGLAILPQEEGAPASMALGDLLPVRAVKLRGRLIVSISIPRNVRLAYAAVARTPADQPIVCAALAAWPSGRTRLALGGYGPAPLLAYDGSEPDEAALAAALELAAANAYAGAGDEWASAEYRSAMAARLALRCLTSGGK